MEGLMTFDPKWPQKTKADAFSADPFIGGAFAIIEIDREVEEGEGL